MSDIRLRSLNFPTSVWLAHVTILLLLCLPGADANLNVTWCLDADKEQLLNLSCGSASLIRISSVFHGWQNVSHKAEPNGCHAPTQDDCNEKYSNVKLMLDTCSGLSTCVISSLEMPMLLNSCNGRRSNYVYVEYECVFVGNQTTIVDICGSRLKQGTTPTGYITSPNYPQNYDANTKCSCRLQTLVDGEQLRSNEIVLQVLDFELSPVPNDRSPFDWLQYGRHGRNWGDGHLMGIGKTADPIFTGSDRVDVDFNTDEQREGRGFWLKYLGLNITSKEEIPVQIECGLYTSPDSRQSLSCFEPPRAGELYLSCTSYGVINILKVQAGYRPPANQMSNNHLLQGCTTDEVIARAMCISEVNIAAIEGQCMRRTTCNPPAPSSANITAACGDRPNDFVLVTYQCIPDSIQSGNMMDVCGEDMDPGTGAASILTSDSGFISSPLYPSNYPPDCNCFCQLEVTSSVQAQVVFYVLDLKLSRTSDEELSNSVCSSMTSGCSSSDWLEYRSIGQSPEVTGRNFSLEGKEEPVYTGSNVVLINFHSDSHMEDRGFWIKYVGRSDDGSNSPVFVHCGRSKPQPSPASATEPRNGTEPSAAGSSAGHAEGEVSHRPDETENSKTGLIVGITVSVIVFVAVLVALVAVFLYKRRSRMQSGKLLNESKTDSLHREKKGSAASGVEGFSRSDRGSQKRSRLFARWKRGISKTPAAIDRPQALPFAVFYNDAYKMQDPTLSRHLHSSVRKKRLSPPPRDFTLHV